MLRTIARPSNRTAAATRKWPPGPTILATAECGGASIAILKSHTQTAGMNSCVIDVSPSKAALISPRPAFVTASPCFTIIALVANLAGSCTHPRSQPEPANCVPW
jgi:hypothetical protein